MSKLFFRYGAMNSGKTTALLQVAHNYEERGQKVIIVKSAVDTKGNEQVVSRLGVSRDADIVLNPEQDLRSLLHERYPDNSDGSHSIDCILIDEAQFLTPDQVDQALQIAVMDLIPVLAYGIRTDFQTLSFPGSKRLMEVAHALEEMKTICRCGRKAIFNARLKDGEIIREGSQVMIDGSDARYEARCARCYLEG
ncbi:MAG: thymidine kinase [Cellvibrionales bacterium]|nr:thymidine kinase [Cellvibrionales bacterium]